MNFIKDLLFNQDSSNGKKFDIFIQILIVLSLINFSLQTLPNLSEKIIKYLDLIEFISVIIFTLEYLSRVIFSEKKVKFIFSFFGIIDFLAILPFYLSLGVDLRSIRAVRLFRLFRILKLLKYNNAIDNLKRSFIEVKNELIIFSIATIFLLYFAAVGIYFFENEAQPETFSSIFHSLWWAVATLTTVGYGDVYPITLGGKIFSTIVVFIGLGLVAVPTGLIASSFSKAFNDKE
tara:strand:+ start:363 stop:1064 length:702 start_codon:yes stop_codon:yes gene_type:complete